MTRNRASWRIDLLASIFGFITICGLGHAAETVIYSQGFETGNGGFTLSLGTTAEWEWGTPSGAVGPGGAHSGTKAWGTDLDNTLNRPAEGSIISPPIALPVLAANQLIRVRFWGFVSLDGMYDRGEFFVSKDGTNWESMSQLYHNMNTSPTAKPQWQKYEFTLPPSYSGQTVYLRFRAAVFSASPTFYCSGGGDLSGFYVDDLAITVFDTTGAQKLFSMEAWEDPSTWASCPWVAPWNGSDFAADNDIYPVARFKANEATDYYKLMKPLVASNGVYPIQIQERESEDSFTDQAVLLQVDHAPDVAFAPDNAGRLTAYRPTALAAPWSATSSDGQDVRGLVSSHDDQGYAAYSGDTVLVDFSAADVSQGAALIIGVKGFLLGAGEEKPYIGTPAVVVETLNAIGQWEERGRVLPRFEYSLAAFDLSAYLNGVQSSQVRLRSISHSIKYHLIDYVALRAGPAPALSIAQTLPSSAWNGTASILDKLLAADGSYHAMAPGNSFLLEFPVQAQAAGTVRDFVFVSKGYYEPKPGTYLIYTWNGAAWELRDARTYPGSDALKDFDLSLFLPDPNGEYRIRVWQDYQYEPAGIDYVQMTVGGLPAPLNFAHDYRTGADIFSLVVTSNNARDQWSGCPRNRVTEYAFTPPGPANVPPSTNPVTVSGTTPPIISWVYSDSEGSPQAQYEIQVWTGPGATGTIVWNPPVFSGTSTSQVYGGPALNPGQTYYARVRANDGTDWGQWAEGSFGAAAICGDLNKDTRVDAADYTLFRSHYGKRPGQLGWLDEADYDGDRIGCLHDYNRWYACYRAYLGTLP